MIKLDVISGFLWAVKTTFILKMLSEVCAGEKVAVLENEFGKVALDGVLLSESKPLAVKELAAGCICCELSGPFEEGILQLIREQQPDRIIIEPTGVARLSDVLSTLQRPSIQEKCILEHIITIVDASRFALMEQYTGVFFQDQLLNAGSIAVSKTQGMNQRNLESLAERIEEYAPEVPVFTSDWDEKGIAAIYASGNLLHPIVHLSEKDEIPFTSTTIRLTKPIRPRTLTELVKELDSGRFGEVMRAKGLFRDNMGGWRVLQYVHGDCRIQEGPSQGTCAITFIGRNMNVSLLRKHFASIAGTIPVGRLHRKIVVGETTPEV